MKQIFKTKQVLETLEAKNQGRSKGDQSSKESSLSAILECQRSLRSPHGRPVSVEPLKFCELDYIYDIDTPTTIYQITRSGGERFALCRTIELCGFVVLEKTIVKEWFPEDDFEGRPDAEREFLAERLLQSELYAYAKLTELQGDIVPYFFGMVRTNPVCQHYHSRGILIEYLADFRRLDHIAWMILPMCKRKKRKWHKMAR
jgi:hypothetical protein